MSEEEKISWKDSNLALIGSDLDKKIKQAAAEGEDAWTEIGNDAGLFVWRVEQFRLVKWEGGNGRFHTGDSYVVLNSYFDNDKLCHDVHIWIGSESTQDEYGTAAYKMVECDDYLSGIAIQHRQVQGHESDGFRSYFDSLTYLEGGVASGFKHVEPTVDEPHLYKIKGTEKGMSLTQVALTKSSLNAGDSFLLFAGKEKVWAWHGTSANPDEKSRANSLGETMCTKGTVVTLEQGEDEDEDFWAILGTDGEIQDADDGDELIQEFEPILFRLISADQEPEEIAKGEKVKVGFGPAVPKISKSLLNDDDTFLLDAGWEIYVWIGTGADRSEKLAAMAHADSYAKKDPRSMDLPVSIIKSGWESSDFNNYFCE